MDEIGLVEAIEVVREELVRAVLAGANRPLQFPINGIELTFQVGVTRESGAGGKVGFRVLELGYQRGEKNEAVHTVSITLGPPLDENGKPYKVVEKSSRRP